VSDTSGSGVTDTPITGSYDKGPVSIGWSISGAGYANCKVTVTFETDLVAENTLSPNDTNWDTGKHSSSDGWVEAAFTMQVPTAGQDGQLTLTSLTWEQGGQGENSVTNEILADWTQAGS
jgi:hypothetical protein